MAAKKAIVSVVMAVAACVLGPVALAQSTNLSLMPPVAPKRVSPIKGGVEALQFTVNTARGGLESREPIAGFVDNTTFNLGAAKSTMLKPGAFRLWLDKSHATLSGQVQNDQMIVEVAGQWDHADKTLRNLGLPYTHIKPRDLTSESLASARVVIINCAGDLKREKLQLLRDFVARGGYLLTTDWALDNTVANTFPGFIAWGKGVNKRPMYQANYVSPDPVLANHTVKKAYWKLDDSAHLVKVLDRQKVRILVTSDELAAEDPERQGILACIFPFGRGYVLHMVGHFDNNARIGLGNFLPDASDDIGISLRQAIATNFVAAGITGTRVP